MSEAKKNIRRENSNFRNHYFIN